MCPENVVRRAAGTLIVLSVALGALVNPWWLAFTAFVGLSLFQYGFTNFCPLSWVFGAARIFGCRVSSTE